MRKWIPWAVAIAAIVLLGGGWLHDVRKTQQQALQQSEQVERRLAAIEQAMGSGGRAGAAAGLQSSDANARAAFADRVKGRMDAGGAARMGLSGTRSMADSKRQLAQDRARLEGLFTGDGSDPGWAQGTEVTATKAIADPVLAPFDAPADSDMRCARTMCRMTFTFDSGAAADDWASYYPFGVAKQLPVMQSQQISLPDGRVQLVMYGFRDPKAKPLQ